MSVIFKIKKQTGFTLIEIMIALLLGLIVIGGALSIYISTIRGSTDVTNSARLNYDLDSSLQFMMNDIRRAGFWGGAVVNKDTRTNLFTIGNADISIPVNTCILYSYDFDSNGSDDGGTLSPVVNEYFGFKLDGDSIKVRLASSADISGDCTGSGWETFTDENKVKVMTLTFSNAGYKCLNVDDMDNPITGGSYNTPCASVSAANLPVGAEAVEIRQINITLTGEVDGDTTVQKTLSGIIKIRNNKVFTN